ncbi:hypothetical protein L916_07234 [Phytophthora nicotianae]|uniref:Uncharacterized protein n=1 Tax=Phytophthora nicotianae TaxID=4792 RepID=W2J7Z4_PHYNI|nr:hypothetical protein L916_07234 [Phytophthora nicotianae]
MDGGRTMTPLARLLTFCAFLEHRLYTSSLALLRRMFTDFYAGNEHTLQDFMRLGATVVTVMPMERKGPRQLKEATRLLDEQKQGNVHETSTEMDPNQQTQMDAPTSCVFRYLSARVATRNILWLRDMFHEFCRGEDALLRQFLRRGDQAISVIPVDIQALSMVPLPPPPLSIDPTFSVAMAETGVRSEASPARSREQEQEQQSGSEPLSETELRARIMEALERLEAKEPWKAVYNPEKLSLPFSRVRYPQLAAVLHEFWQKNARAVWERKFWSPLSRSRNLELHNQRRCRQIKAVTFFEKKVIIPIYNEFGASIFIGMDKRAKPCSGWYHFDQAVDLFTLAQRNGLPACLQYVESEAFKRFPTVPGKNRSNYARVNGKSRSMWSSSESLGQILGEIIALKAKSEACNKSVEL